MQTININGKDFTIKELTSALEKAKNSSPMLEVYKYHKTTEEEFNNLYKNIPEHIKNYAMECLIVEYYNKGWKPDWKDSNQRKYYPYFYMHNFSLSGASYYGGYSSVPARLCFKSEQDVLDAVKKFPNIFKNSRLS